MALSAIEIYAEEFGCLSPASLCGGISRYSRKLLRCLGERSTRRFLLLGSLVDLTKDTSASSHNSCEAPSI